MVNFTRAEIIRKISASGRVELAGQNLSGLDLSGLALDGADLSYADLTGTDLSGTRLAGGSLWSARAGGACFRGADLSGASLGLADLAHADLRGALLERADLTGARLDGADLTEARMQGVWLDAMQRALAIGAPPLRYPSPDDPAICILDEDHLDGPVALRCGDRLEIHLRNPDPASDQASARARIEGAPVLAALDSAALDLADPLRGALHVLAFDAVAPGRTRLVIEPGNGRAPVTLKVQITP